MRPIIDCCSTCHVFGHFLSRVSLKSNRFYWLRHPGGAWISGLLDMFDAKTALPLIAPRPLLVLNGELDPRNPRYYSTQCVS